MYRWAPCAAILLAASPLAAQVPVIEPDAPERQFAGCYAVHTTDGRTLFDLADVAGPDTIRLSLDLGTVGWSISNRPWRQAGWMLAMHPQQTGGMHDMSRWGLSDDSLRIAGSGWQELSFRIVASVMEGRVSAGALTRMEDGPEARPSAVRLERVACPPDDYFRRVERLIRDKFRAPVPVEAAIGNPMPLPAPGAVNDDVLDQNEARCYALEALTAPFVGERIPERIALFADGRGLWPWVPAPETAKIDPLALAPVEWARTAADSTRIVINGGMWGKELVFAERQAALGGRAMTWSDIDSTRRYPISGTRIECSDFRWFPPSPRARRFSER